MYCRLFDLDNYKKEKDALLAYFERFYSNKTLLKKFIYSDGPDSEFKTGSDSLFWY